MFFPGQHFSHPDILRTEFNGMKRKFGGRHNSCPNSTTYRYYAQKLAAKLAERYNLEADAIRKITPDIPITTNLMGFYKPLDYQKWAKSMDFISWDNYPAPDDSPAHIAMNHDLMRGIKDQNSFVLMEQTPSVTNWLPYNKLKRPGEMRRLSYQAAAHGADAIQFFQIRRTVGACEKSHGAFIDHAGRDDTRVFRELKELGSELESLGDVFLEGRTPAEVAIVVDWDNWWALENSAGPSIHMKYLDALRDYYSAAFGQNGGTFITTYFSGIVDEHDLVILGGYPGKLRDILGIWVEENDALPEGEKNSFQYGKHTYPAQMLCDLMHLEGAEEISSYKEDFYANTPVITKNSFGKGSAYYVGTRSNDEFYAAFLEDVFKEARVRSVLTTPEGVEASVRRNEKGEVLFLLNHSKEEQEVVLEDNYLDLLDKDRIRKGETIKLEKNGVRLLFHSALTDVK